jgi:hypothetical protein
MPPGRRPMTAFTLRRSLASAFSDWIKPRHHPGRPLGQSEGLEICFFASRRSALWVRRLAYGPLPSLLNGRLDQNS